MIPLYTLMSPLNYLEGRLTCNLLDLFIAVLITQLEVPEVALSRFMVGL